MATPSTSSPCSTRKTTRERAKAATREGGKLLTTQWVLTELADAMAPAAKREGFLLLAQALESDSAVEIVPATADLFRRGIDLYRGRPDKDWSLTDCISFVVMNDRAVTEALTGDRHFEQAGFVPLLKR